MFETTRLLLCPWKVHDLDRLFELLRDPDVMHFFGAGHPLSYAETKTTLDYFIDHYHTYNFSPGAIVLKENMELVGCGGLDYSPSDQAPAIRLTFLLQKAYWGKGLATEMARAAIAYGFGELRIKHIVATARPENKASIKVLEKVGMTYQRYNPETNRLEYQLDNPIHALRACG